MIQKMHAMKNLLFLIVFTITSFFNTAVSQTIFTNPFNGEEVELNEKQQEKFTAKERFILSTKNHFTWTEVYILDPAANLCIDQSFGYTLLYYLVVLSLIPFAFNRVYRNHEGNMYKQRFLYLTFLCFIGIIALSPFEAWKLSSIILYCSIGIIVCIIFIAVILYFTTLDNFKGVPKKILVLSALIFLIGGVSYFTNSIGYANFFREVLAPLIVWMSIFFLLRIINENVLIEFATERKQVKMIVHKQKFGTYDEV